MMQFPGIFQRNGLEKNKNLGSPFFNQLSNNQMARIDMGVCHMKISESFIHLHVNCSSLLLVIYSVEKWFVVIVICFGFYCRYRIVLTAELWKKNSSISFKMNATWMQKLFSI
jgi:hypothetical protein